MGKTFKDKRKYLDKDNPKPKKKWHPEKGRKKTEKQEFEDLLNNEDFTLGI